MFLNLLAQFGGPDEYTPDWWVEQLTYFIQSRAIPAMGEVVAVVVGGYFAFLVIKKAMSWGKSAL